MKLFADRNGDPAVTVEGIEQKEAIRSRKPTSSQENIASFNMTSRQIWAAGTTAMLAAISAVHIARRWAIAHPAIPIIFLTHEIEEFYG